MKYRRVPVLAGMVIALIVSAGLSGSAKAAGINMNGFENSRFTFNRDRQIFIDWNRFDLNQDNSNFIDANRFDSSRDNNFIDANRFDSSRGNNFIDANRFDFDRDGNDFRGR